MGLTADLDEHTTLAADDKVKTWDTSDVGNRDKWMALAKFVLKSGTPTAGNVASWASATLLQDSGVALSNLAKLAAAQTFSGAKTFSALITANNGINFGQSTLNYYDEGTWTPALVVDATVTYTSRTGYYRRIGKIVHAWANITVNTRSGGTGAANVVVSVPFACKAGMNYFGGSSAVGKFGWVELLSGFPTSCFIYGHDGVTIKVSEIANGSSWAYSITYPID
jgi:hypothetical protein